MREKVGKRKCVTSTINQSRAFASISTRHLTFLTFTSSTSRQIMELSQLAVPSVYSLIFFLAYPSQWLLMYLQPGPLTKNDLIAVNAAAVLIFITYTKTVFVDPGTIPKDWVDKQEPGKVKGAVAEKEAIAKIRKWCRKCDAAKPPRAHHCKACKRFELPRRCSLC